MITEENIAKVIESIEKEQFLTTKQLNDLGLTSHDLKNLVSEGFLNRLKRGQYNLSEIKELYNKGLKALEKKDYDIASNYLNKCFELNPFYEKTSFLAFSANLCNRDLDASVICLQKMIEQNNLNNKDYNLILYLMNYIVELPPHLKELAENISKQDLLLNEDDKGYKNINTENTVRIDAFSNNFNTAARELQKSKKLNIYNNILKKLLIMAKKKTSQNLKVVNSLIRSKEYSYALNILKNNKKHNRSEEINIKLLEILIKINTGEEIPKTTILNTTSFIEAIEENNFELALKISKQYAEYHNINFENNVTHNLLLEIVNILNKRKFSPSYLNVNPTKEYSSLIESLENESSKFTEILLNFLITTNNQKYEKLIKYMIKMDKLDNNKEYTCTKTILNMIYRNDFTLKRTYFIRMFKEKLANNLLDEAEIYLEIIGCLEDIKEEHNLYRFFKKELNIKRGISSNNIKTNGYITDRDLLFLNQIITKLKKESGMFLLKPMDEETRLRVHEQIKNVPNINSVSMDINGKKRIMLTYTIAIFNMKRKVRREAILAYGNKDYNKSIILYKKLIAYGNNEHYLYGNIGTSYLMNGYYKKALNYLLVAYEKAKGYNEEDALNYLSKIESITKMIEPEEEKSYVKFTENEFNESKSSDGLNCLNDILYLIYEEKYSIEDACLQFNLSEDEINIVRLYCAKDHYTNSRYESGDKIMKKVERSKNKSKTVKNLFSEIQKNKLFYKNRENDKTYKKV